ncbi:transposase domain-containing protein, partial [Streptomyces chartreusis]|uniref:transposase domain-containing protein n=1 Tax=Streptomyces chartreusis TaxID=1969 RepID=UPI003817901F
MGVRCCAVLPGVVRVSADVGELSGLGLLTWVYPSGLVDRVVAACGRAEQRRRLLPARLVVYFVLALALFSPAPYLDVMRHLVEGLRGAGLLGEWRIPAKSSLFRARQRHRHRPGEQPTEPNLKTSVTTVNPLASRGSRRSGEVGAGFCVTRGGVCGRGRRVCRSRCWPLLRGRGTRRSRRGSS